MYEVVRTSVCA